MPGALRSILEALQKGQGVPAKQALELTAADRSMIQAAAREAIPEGFTPVFRGYSGGDSFASRAMLTPRKRGEDVRLWSTLDPILAAQYTVPRSGFQFLQRGEPKLGALELYGLNSGLIADTDKRFKFTAKSRYRSPNSLLDELEDYEELDRQLRRESPAARLAEYVSGALGGVPGTYDYARLALFENVPDILGVDKQQQLVVREPGQKMPLRMSRNPWKRPEVEPPEDLLYLPKARGGRVR